jgi:hypothetical protein
MEEKLKINEQTGANFFNNKKNDRFDKKNSRIQFQMPE